MADLPIDIMSQIAIRLSRFDDFVVCGAVCKSWHSAITSLPKPPLAPKFPWLMLAQEDDKRGLKSKEDAIQTRSFLSLSDHKTYKILLPEAVGRKCLGASFGWLLTIGIDLEIKLLNPLSRLQISLPPQPSFNKQYREPPLEPVELRDMFVAKVALSTNPWKSHTQVCDSSCVVMAIYGELKLLAFARLGSKAWIDVPSSTRRFDDIIHFKGKFHAVDCHGVAFICDINDDRNPKATAIAGAPKGTKDWIKKYLVKSSGKLLLVQRIYGGMEDNAIDSDYDRYEPGEEENMCEVDGSEDEESEQDSEEEDIDDVTVSFSVMKLVKSKSKESKYKYRWVKVDSLGDQALFLGENSSISLPASSFSGCKANCIYFTDDNTESYPFSRNGGGNDMGIFSMEDAKIEHYHTCQSLSYFSPPLWYI